MRKLLFILTLLGCLSLHAKDYTIQEIPMVHLQDRTRYVSNPDGILSPSAVAEMDQILYQLEEKTGIQTLVVAVTGIEGGDCFDFAHRLFNETGVGRKSAIMVWSSYFPQMNDVYNSSQAMVWKEYCPTPSANESKTVTW